MTPDEHQLIIEMFKHLTVVYAGLVEALKSRGVLERGDLQAFDALVTASSRKLVEQNIDELYRSTAAILGVTGLPSL